MCTPGRGGIGRGLFVHLVWIVVYFCVKSFCFFQISYVRLLVALPA